MRHQIPQHRRLLSVLAGGALLLAPLPAAAQSGIATPFAGPMAVAARLDRTVQGARLTFDLSRAVAAKAFVLENPDRVVIEAPPINFQLDPALGAVKGGGLVKAFRFGSYAADRSRIVIDLAGPAEVQTVATTNIAGREAARLSIQLGRTDRASFHQAALQGAAAQNRDDAAAAPVPRAAEGGKPVVMIDPGHGGIDPGASGIGGVVEKDITFAFAQALAAKLTGTGRYTVLLTRSSDTFVSLPERVRITRDAHAALFVSIHADTVAEGEGVSGATVYTASDRATDAEAARVAAKENKVDLEAGVEPAPDTGDVNDILFDLTRRETRTFSHVFQRTLAGYWQKVAHLNKNPERAAGFWVLKAPDVPSVLLELGYLSSPTDVAALTAPQWRDKAVGAVAASIGSFFDARGHDPQGGAMAQAALPGDPDRTATVILRPHL
ncbi:N-acetylmuramoyl-L-alanine amidase [Lichenihabitans sp. Uapishka_5]|uniref:N-acetylmuramoyl-L-alanine amidase n=1 Tax=Lichenihabitans sp. Uapishka_5 TaxID=3037302 RepID=UPI0029E80A27|nr:N-acetylmuramoyl-L-alanine amidase [Lichenihabitans sp. Uapishka_5]MDX7952014.1 N-acetylmuramoyl-L-alanine amidase [Lichenihabitans sp. Uapishka_5]